MLEQCSCTADCGDCPGIARGTHAPCEFKLNNDTAKERQHKAEALSRQLGYSDPLEALEALSVILKNNSHNISKDNLTLRFLAPIDNLSEPFS